MNIRIGIIGPEDSVKQILAVAKEFDQVTFIPLMYQNVYQVDELIQQNVKPIDQWLFSGVLNYNYAIKKQLVDQRIATYPPLHGLSFFGTLLEAQLLENKVFKKFSIDTFSNREIEKVLSFYELDDLQFVNHPFSDYTYIHQLTDFHENAYRNGEAEIAITSTNYAYVRLREKNIPVYRMNPSYLSIQLSIKLLIERAQVNRFKKSQIAIIGISVDFRQQINTRNYNAYRMKQDELDIKKELLYLSEKVSGSFISSGYGSYLIYTNRGEITDDMEQFIISLSKKIYATHQLNVQFSIGYGETAFQAEQHVNLGFKQDRDDFSIIIVDENQNILIRKKNQTIRFATVSSDEFWEKKIKQSGISFSVLSKIISLAQHYDRTEFTAVDLSRWLKTSDRNARRILLQLERGGLIEQCGEVQSGGRGRPRKLYRFADLDDQE